MKRPIVVTGSHRSGTTWVGRMLCLSREAGYIHEPFNPNRWPGWSRSRIPYWYLHIAAHNERDYRPLVDDVLEFRYPIGRHLLRVRDPKQLALVSSDATRSVAYRIGKPRPLVKDPFALFSSEWLARAFDAQVVVMIRHPAAFASSLKRLNWQFKFRGWIAQPELVRTWLGGFEAEMVAQANDDDVDIIDQAILLWRGLHHVIDDYRKHHPEWAFVRHEDLAADPIAGFRDLYERLGLTWGPRVADKIASFSRGEARELPTWRRRAVRRDSATARASWRWRLTTEEIARIRAGVSDIAPRFYADEEW